MKNENAAKIAAYIKALSCHLLSGSKEWKDYVQDRRLPDTDRQKSLSESKSEALELEKRTSLLSYRKVAYIFLILHYGRKSLWALCVQVLSYATNIDTHRMQTVFYKGHAV